MSSPATPGRRSFKLLGWAAFPVLALAGVVQVTGVGIDILVLAAAGLVLLGLERSVGDWLGEWIGPLAAALIFVAAAAALVWFFLADSLGRSQTERFFVEAERRGYSTVFYETAPSSSADKSGAVDGSSLAPPPVATAGRQVSRPSGAQVHQGPPGTAPVGAAAERRDEETAQDVAAAVPAAGPTGANRSKGHAPTKTSLLSFLRRSSSRPEPIATEIAVSLSGSQITAGRRTVITARVHGAGAAVTSGSVEFMVNGLGAGRVALNVDGMASTTFLTHIPGPYEVRARYSGTSTHASSRSDPVIFTVLAGR